MDLIQPIKKHMWMKENVPWSYRTNRIVLMYREMIDKILPE